MRVSKSELYREAQKTCNGTTVSGKKVTHSIQACCYWKSKKLFWLLASSFSIQWSFGECEDHLEMEDFKWKIKISCSYLDKACLSPNTSLKTYNSYTTLICTTVRSTYFSYNFSAAKLMVTSFPLQSKKSVQFYLILRCTTKDTVHQSDFPCGSFERIHGCSVRYRQLSSGSKYSRVPGNITRLEAPGGSYRFSWIGWLN